MLILLPVTSRILSSRGWAQVLSVIMQREREVYGGGVSVEKIASYVLTPCSQVGIPDISTTGGKNPVFYLFFVIYNE